jgi:hypothetical protein
MVFCFTLMAAFVVSNPILCDCDFVCQSLNS